MIEEQYVSFDTAKMLKEAGFDVPCRGVYVTDRTGYYEFREYDNKQTKDDLCLNTEDGFQYEYLAPTQALAARWLREVYNLHISTEPYAGTWHWVLWNVNGTFITNSATRGKEDFETCEEAIEDALREAIKLVK